MILWHASSISREEKPHRDGGDEGDQPVSKSSKSSAESFLPRAAVLVVFVIVLDLWGSQHFGLGFRNPGVIAGVVAAIAYAVNLVGRLVPKSERENAGERLAGWIRRALTPEVLLVLGTAMLLLMASVSSVTVIGDTADANTRISVYPVGSPDRVRVDSLSSAPGLARFLVLSSALGRTFRVEASGYLPAAFDVYPVVGRKIRLGRDMSLAPTVLFRPSVDALRSLAGGGSLHVYRIEGGDKRLVVDTTGLEPAAYYIGRPPALPSSTVKDWERALSGQLPPSVIDQTILRWKTLVALTTGDVAPGVSLMAEVVSRAGKPVARAEVVVGESRLVDVPLMDVKS